MVGLPFHCISGDSWQGATAESSRVDMDQRLKNAARDLSELVSVFPLQHLGDLLDLTAGALARLIRAEQLEYIDRVDVELPPEYYNKLTERIARMANGTLPPRGRWISGYYFNSALLRLGAAREITKRLLDSLDKHKPDAGPNLKPMPSDTIYEEYRSLKHDLRSLGMGRNVTFEQTLQALAELIGILCRRRDELCDVNTKFPSWKKEPRG